METKTDHSDHDENRWMRRGLPPWPVLISFICVVETGNVTKTALRLNLTQSAVSHHIAQLERFVGDRLFERSGKALKPTAKAKTLVVELRATLRALSSMIEAARPSSGQTNLHVVVAPEFYRHWLEPRLNGFLASHPHVQLRISQDYRRDVLIEDAADLHIRLGRPMANETGTVLCADTEFVVCSPDLAKKLPPKQAFAVAHFLTHADAYHTSLDWRRWLSELFGIDGERWLQDHLAKMVMFENFEQMLAACRRGEGFALVRTILVCDEISSGCLVKAVTETLAADANYSVIHKSGIGLSKAAQSFINWVRKEATPMRQ